MEVPQEELAILRLNSAAASLFLQAIMQHLREADTAPDPAPALVGAREGLRDALLRLEQVDVTLDRLGVSRVGDLDPEQHVVPVALLLSPNNCRLYSQLQAALTAAEAMQEERGYTGDQSPIASVLDRLMVVVTAELNGACAADVKPSDTQDDQRPGE